MFEASDRVLVLGLLSVGWMYAESLTAMIVFCFEILTDKQIRNMGQCAVEKVSTQLQ